MAAPDMYYVSENGDDADSGAHDAPWATLVHALDGTSGAGISHDSTNGVQINCHGTITATRSIDIASEYTDMGAGAGPTAAAPLILKGWNGAEVTDDLPVAAQFTYTGLLVGPAYTDFFEEGMSPASDVMFIGFTFSGGSTSHPGPFITGGSRWTFLDCVFTTSASPTTGAGAKLITLTDDAKFIGCSFTNIGHSSSGSSHNVVAIQNRATFYGCHFDFNGQDQDPYSCIRFNNSSTPVGSHYIIDCVFECEDSLPLNFNNTGGEQVFVLNNSFISDSGNSINCIGGGNVASTLFMFSNLATGWNNALGPNKSAHNCIFGGNSGYNNTTDFPTSGDTWHETGDSGNDDNISLSDNPFAAGNIPQSAIEDSGSREGVLGVAYPNYIGSNGELLASRDRGAAQKAAIVPNKVTSSVSGIF